MGRIYFQVTAPDGTVLKADTADHNTHTVAVIGLMRLRKPLPKVNEKDPNEEVQYDRFKAWVMIGTAANMQRAERLAKCQGYKGVTEEVQFLPVVGFTKQKTAGEVEDADGDEVPPVACSQDA